MQHISRYDLIIKAKEEMKFLNEWLPTQSKNMVTREIKRAEEYYNDVKKAYDERSKHGIAHGWLHGEKIWYLNVLQAKYYLDRVIEFRKNMK